MNQLSTLMDFWEFQSGWALGWLALPVVAHPEIPLLPPTDPVPAIETISGSRGLPISCRLALGKAIGSCDIISGAAVRRSLLFSNVHVDHCSVIEDSVILPKGDRRFAILENGTVRPLDLKVGDKVLFGKYGGTEVKVDGEDLLVMREEDVMAVIEGK